MRWNHTDEPAESSLTHALIAGFAGAVAVNVLHEATRYAAGGDPSPDVVPRLDRLGEESLAMGMERLGLEPPEDGPKRYAAAMAGDVLMNTLCYATAGLSKSPARGGVMTALVGGVAGLLLPKLVGLEKYRGTTPRAMALTFADYAVGGLVSGAVLSALRPRRSLPVRGGY